ncbi:hypothetical protein DI09_282p20 [Mitosporidium daphniae]|uniref:Uncharacterized protein n=1 Tax=Mitosporidium daphniae TaxID=1485682 RepID=A0A098VVJ7_9MICR|nr:uncharacterized protein DI09_282p20 [Mitosporidium daphniae]KGG51756.1 hypothetical protein DI09_282p20 [Mitosporidium daphniae]|eukprot:XP_013238192.1 uncharacterized protein DI09_282p20 [Mitosporidium daphniae]
MFCWRLVHFPESQDLDTMQEDNISSLDDILAHLIILFAHDRASLLNHIVQMFQKIGIHVAVDTPSFNEVLSSLCFSVLFKLFNLFLSFTHANWKQKLFSPVSHRNPRTRYADNGKHSGPAGYYEAQQIIKLRVQVGVNFAVLRSVRGDQRKPDAVSRVYLALCRMLVFPC